MKQDSNTIIDIELDNNSALIYNKLFQYTTLLNFSNDKLGFLITVCLYIIGSSQQEMDGTGHSFKN